MIFINSKRLFAVYLVYKHQQQFVRKTITKMYFKCHLCTEIFSRRYSLKRHNIEYHAGGKVKHNCCSKVNAHVDLFPNLPKEEKNGIIRIVSAQSFNGLLKIIRFYPAAAATYKTPDVFFNEIKDFVNETLQTLKEEGGYIKVVTKCCVMFTKLSDPNITDDSYFTIPSTYFLTYNINNIISRLLSKIESYTKRGSNWTLTEILFFELNVIMN